MPRLRRKSRQKLQRLCFLVHREKAERMHGKLQNVRRMSLKFLKSLEIRLSDDEFQAVSALSSGILRTGFGRTLCGFKKFYLKNINYYK